MFQLQSNTGSEQDDVRTELIAQCNANETLSSALKANFTRLDQEQKCKFIVWSLEQLKTPNEAAKDAATYSPCIHLLKTKAKNDLEEDEIRYYWLQRTLKRPKCFWCGNQIPVEGTIRSQKGS